MDFIKSEVKSEPLEGSDFPQSNSSISIQDPRLKPLQLLADKCNGNIIDSSTILNSVSSSRREVLQRTTFRGTLDITNDLKIPIYCFLKSSETKFPTLTSVSKLAVEGTYFYFTFHY